MNLNQEPFGAYAIKEYCLGMQTTLSRTGIPPISAGGKECSQMKGMYLDIRLQTMHFTVLFLVRPLLLCWC